MHISLEAFILRKVAVWGYGQPLHDGQRGRSTTTVARR